MIFQGHYAESTGTNLFFAAATAEEKENYFAASTKILRFRRVVLEDKSTDPVIAEEDENPNESPEDNDNNDNAPNSPAQSSPQEQDSMDISET